MSIMTPGVRFRLAALRAAAVGRIAAVTYLAIGCGSTAAPASFDGGIGLNGSSGASGGGTSSGSSGGSGDMVGEGSSGGSSGASSSGTPTESGDDGGPVVGSDGGPGSSADAGAACTKVVTSSMDCSAPLAPGDYKTCTLGSRQYLLYAPKNLNVCEPTALVIDAHGATQTAPSQLLGMPAFCTGTTPAGTGPARAGASRPRPPAADSCSSPRCRRRARTRGTRRAIRCSWFRSSAPSRRSP